MWTSNALAAVQATLNDTSIALSTRKSALVTALNTILQGAWALLLGRYSGEEDVVFGGVVSGRPVDLAGSETMVGL